MFLDFSLFFIFPLPFLLPGKIGPLLKLFSFKNLLFRQESGSEKKEKKKE